MATILVTGASGFVGSHAVPALLDAGHRVVALARSPESAAKVLRRLNAEQASRTKTVIGDVTRRDTLPVAPDGVDAVLHLVAIPRDFSGGAERRKRREQEPNAA